MGKILRQDSASKTLRAKKVEHFPCGFEGHAANIKGDMTKGQQETQ